VHQHGILLTTSFVRLCPQPQYHDRTSGISADDKQIRLDINLTACRFKWRPNNNGNIELHHSKGLAIETMSSNQVPATIKALVHSQSTGVLHLEEELPTPKPTAEEYLLKVDSCALTTSETEWYETFREIVFEYLADGIPLM
jgi:hypothetical protein